MMALVAEDEAAEQEKHEDPEDELFPDDGVQKVW